MTHRHYCQHKSFRRRAKRRRLRGRLTPAVALRLHARSRAAWPGVPVLRRYHRLADRPRPEHKWSEL